MLNIDDGEAAQGASGEFPRGYWYAALASQRLADKPVGIQVLDWRLALFRDADGRPHALQDRCAHRGVELHLGEVTDGALACRYHGWRYGGDGRCIHIPSLVGETAIAKGAEVRAFPCREADAYVWIWMGEDEPIGAPTPIAEFGHFNWIQGSTPLKCAALAAIENNVDWCHPVFAHPFTHGQFFANLAMGFQTQVIEMRRTDRGLVVFAPAAAAADDPIPPMAPVALRFELPDRVTVALNIERQPPARIVMHMVPTGAATCRQEWMFSSGLVSEQAKPQVSWSDEVNPVLDQDRQVLESLQIAVDREGRAFERSVEADAPTLLARRIYALACAGRWDEEQGRLASRRSLTVRS